MSVIKQILLAVLGIIVMLSCNRNLAPASDNYLMNEYVVGKISVLHSNEEHASGLVTILDMERPMSFMYGYNNSYKCPDFMKGKTVYFKLQDIGGVIIATNLRIDRPEMNEIFTGNLNNIQLFGKLNLARGSFNHINENNCFSFGLLHTKYHYYKVIIEADESGYTLTSWRNGSSMGTNEINLWLNTDFYNNNKQLLESSRYENFDGWYIDHHNSYIYDISLTHNH